MKIILVTILFVACFLSAFGSPFERGECQYCSQKVDYIRGFLPDYDICDEDDSSESCEDDDETPPKITRDMLVYYLRKSDTATPPIHVDCLQFYNPSTIDSLLTSYRKKVSTSQICSGWIKCANILSLIFC